MLWDLFPDKFFCCLFLFCSTVSLIVGFWHQTLRWCSHRSVCLHLVALYFIDSNVLAVTYASCCYIIFLQQQFFSNIRLCNVATPIVLIMKLCKVCICIEVASTFSFALKSCHCLSLSWRCASSCICICICIEASPLLCLLKRYLHLSFLMKPFPHEATSILYLHWSHANIHFFHDIVSTLHLHWSRTNIVLYNGATLAQIFRGNKV